MTAPRYKIWAVGGAVGQGAMNSYHVGIAGIGKAATKDHPYAISNEYICNRLAQPNGARNEDDLRLYCDGDTVLCYAVSPEVICHTVREHMTDKMHV